MPVEAEPMAPATQPALVFTQLTQGPLAACSPTPTGCGRSAATELAARTGRLGDPGEAPATQMQLALALAQTRVPADLARALGLLQRVIDNPSPEAQPLQPLARALAARYQSSSAASRTTATGKRSSCATASGASSS